MRINKNNYETFVIDFLEGNLSEEMTREFELFLSNHPEIHDEIANLDEAILPLNDLVFDDKYLLKKDAEKELEKIDLLLAKKLEGNLSKEEVLLIDKMLLHDQETKKSWEMMQKTVLHAETSTSSLFSSLKFPDAIDYSSPDNLLIGKLEGDLDSKQLISANKLITKGEKEFQFYKNTFVQADESILFTNKAELKKALVIPMWKKLIPVISIAAMFVLGFFLFSESNHTEIAKSIELRNHQKVERFIIEKETENNLADKIIAPIIIDSQNKKVKNNKPIQVEEEMKYERVLTPDLANTIPYNLVKNVDQDKTIKTQKNQFVEPHQVTKAEDLADNNMVVQDNKNYKSFRDFATEKAKETLWGDEEYPQDNYTAALIEKTAQKVEVLDNSLPVVSKDDSGWAFRFKKFSVERKKS